MIQENLNQQQSCQSACLKKTRFSQNHETLQQSIVNQNRRQRLTTLKGYIKKYSRKKQNINFSENFQNLIQNTQLEGFSDEILSQQHQCFSYFNTAIQNSRTLKQLDISGMDINPVLAIEIGQAIQKNYSLQDINLSGCQLNCSSLQYIFSSISNHKTLKSINLFNNQGFSNDLINDLSEFVFKGKNCLEKLKLTHCNISSTAISCLLRNLKYSKTLTSLDLSMMDFNTDTLTSLGIALMHYKGKHVLEYLNIGFSNIRNQGLEVLAQRVNWNFRKINLKELVLKRNFISQQGVKHLEKFLIQIQQLQRLDLSQNKIEEFNCQHLLQRQLYEINLSFNLFCQFPTQFFMNSLVINLSNNNIGSQGAFQLSSIIRQNPLWIELILSNNNLFSEGFNSLIFGLRDNKLLKKLIVSNNKIDGEGIFTYMINYEQVNFEHLDISYNCIRHELIYFILTYMKGGSLKSLKCQGLEQQKNSEIQNVDDLYEEYDLDKFNNGLYQEDLVIQTEKQQCLFQISSYNLRELDFANNPYIFRPIINSLATYYNKVEILDLSSCKPINEFEIDLVCSLLQQSAFLHQLNLSNLGLGNQPLKFLRRLRSSVLISSLKVLHVSGNELFQAAKVFSDEDTILNYKLEKLNYSHNGFQAKHANYLEQILTCYKNLKELDLSYNSIDCSGLIMMKRLQKQKPTLKHLNLSNQKLSADDLVIVSEIINTQNLTSLNLSNNNSVKRTKTFLNLCSSQKQEILKLNHINFDKFNFQNCIEVIQRQRKHLLGVFVEFCNFPKNGCDILLQELKKCKNLQVLSLDYNPFMQLDLEKAAELLNQIKKIKILELTQISFSRNSFLPISQWLQNQNTCNVDTLKIIEIKLEQEQLDDICHGIAENESLKNLILDQCGLGLLNFYNLGKAIVLNNQLECVSLENNIITQNMLSCKKGIVETKKSKTIKILNLSKNPIDEETLMIFFAPYDSSGIGTINVLEIKLSDCHITFQSFEQFISKNKIVDEKFENKTKSVFFNNNQFQDSHCAALAQYITLQKSLEYLYLAQNQISSKGIEKILKVVLKNQNIKLLDLSYNMLDDQFVILIKNLMASVNTKLQFLLIRGNKFSEKGQKWLSQILKEHENLFIDNIWAYIDDQDAEQILKQYMRIGQQFRQYQLPQYVKEIFLINSNLTDNFCKSFGKYYPLLSFVELIDVSDNPFITMYGKTYLFFHLFNLSFDKHNLKALHITNSQECRNLYDDGLFRYLILNLRNVLLRLNQKINPNPKASEKETSNQILGGMLGSWIIHKLNKILFYLDLIQPPNFIVSTLFIGKFRRNNKALKLLTGLFLLVFLILNIFQYRNLMFLDYQNPIECQFSQVLQDKCELNKQLVLSNFTFTLIFIVTVLLLELSSLLFIVVMRRKIQPALQIVYPKMLQQLKSKFPTKSEISLMIISLFKKIETFPERMFLSKLLQIYDSEDYIQFYKYFFTIVIISRGVDQIIIAVFNYAIFLRANPRDDEKLVYYELASNILASFCPIIGYSFSKSIKISALVILECYRMIFFDLTLFAAIWRFSLKVGIANLNTSDFENPSEFQFWLTLFYLKCIISVIVSIVNILTFRPAVVKQHSFNQALAIKRFHQSKALFIKPKDLKIHESIQQLIEKIDKIHRKRLISFKELDQKSGRLKTFDFELEMNQIEEEENENTIVGVKSDEQFSESQVDSDESPQSPLKLQNPKKKGSK